MNNQNSITANKNLTFNDFNQVIAINLPPEFYDWQWLSKKDLTVYKFKNKKTNYGWIRSNKINNILY